MKNLEQKSNLKEKKKRHLSQLELALIAEIDKTTLWKLETGKTEPTFKTLKKIAKAFDMNVFSLMDVSKVDL